MILLRLCFLEIIYFSTLNLSGVKLLYNTALCQSYHCICICLLFQTELAPGHLHRGGIWISRVSTNHIVWVCVWGGALASVADAKACNRFLMCAVLSVSLSLSKSITFSKEGRGWKVEGTVINLGGGGGGGTACSWRGQPADLGCSEDDESQLKTQQTWSSCLHSCSFSHRRHAAAIKALKYVHQLHPAYSCTLTPSAPACKET